MFGKKEPTEQGSFRIDEMTADWQPVQDEEEDEEQPVVTARAPFRFTWRLVYEAAAIFCTAVVITFLFFMLFRPVTVEGNSMLPTLSNGDHLLLYCFNYTPERGDIVVVQREAEEPLVKRVIAVEGDTIFIDPVDECIYLNGRRLQEPYVSGSTAQRDLIGEVTVPEGHVVVLGDNRPNSHDSRSSDIGMINVESVVGKAFVRLSPTFTVFNKAEE